jgi:aminopeptidase N
VLSAVLAVILVAGVSPVSAGVEPVVRCSKARAAAASCAPGGPTVRVADLTVDPYASDTDFLHGRLQLEVRPATGWIGGRHTMTLRSLRAGLTAFRFRLDQRLQVGAVLVRSGAAKWQRIDAATVEVTVDPPVDGDALFEVAVDYQGYPVSTGSGGLSFAGRTGRTVAWTLSEPWYAYTWFPVKDENTDKATFDLEITVPSSLSVAANGTLAGVDAVDSSRTRYRWTTTYPTAPYLVCFSAAPYRTFSSTFSSDGVAMPVSFFLYPEHDSPANRSAWLASVAMLGVFARLFGPYPFAAEKYGIYDFPLHGGMEHQTMTGQGGFSELLTSHELSHQWWGDMITCATWHDIWLNEGFATYAEALWMENRSGTSDPGALTDAMAARRPGSVAGSVYVYDTSNDARIFSDDFSYLKGGWVLHMLRHVLGDQHFFAALASYRRTFAYGAAGTQELQAVVEGEWGKDLGWFFEPWVYGIGAPSYEYGWRSYTAGGVTWLDLAVSQTQDPTWPVFPMPIDVRAFSNGSATTSVVFNGARTQHVLVPATDPVDDVVLDPDGWILSTATTPVLFSEGPPRVVATSPPPGGRAATVEQIRITFHKDVAISRNQVTLAGADSGAVPFELGYDSSLATATLVLTGPLPPDGYTLTVSDAVVDTASGQALDGEAARPDDPAALPSGDGLAGGAFAIRFTVARPPRLRLTATH